MRGSLADLLGIHPGRATSELVGGESVMVPVAQAVYDVKSRVAVLLPYDELAARDVRQLVRQTLIEWGRPEVVDDAEQVVAELVVNAVRHTDGHGDQRISFRMEIGAHSEVHLVVEDGSRTPPRLVSEADADESGRGMALVHALAEGHWGVTLRPLGKAVYVDLARDVA